MKTRISQGVLSALAAMAFIAIAYGIWLTFAVIQTALTAGVGQPSDAQLGLLALIYVALPVAVASLAAIYVLRGRGSPAQGWSMVAFGGFLLAAELAWLLDLAFRVQVTPPIPAIAGTLLVGAAVLVATQSVIRRSRPARLGPTRDHL